MRPIWDALRKHLRQDFRWNLYGTLALFLVLFITFNYSVNLERGIIDSYRAIHYVLSGIFCSTVLPITVVY